MSMIVLIKYSPLMLFYVHFKTQGDLDSFSFKTASYTD